MKKLVFSMLITLMFLLPGLVQPVLAVEMGGYLDLKLQVSDTEAVLGTNKMKLDLQSTSDTYSLVISLNGVNQYGPAFSNTLELGRAYLTLYPAWGKFTYGLQNIAWGSGYLFNLADLFNQPNPMDPKGEKAGINAAALKCNFSDTAFGEMVLLSAAHASDSDYGARGKFTLGRFDIIFDAVKKTTALPVPEPSSSIRERRANVFELRGELGENLPGIWAQYGIFNDRTNTDGVIIEENYYSYTIGSDYSINLGTGWYWLAEYIQTEKMDGPNQIYITTRYSPDNNWTLMGSLFRDIQNDAEFYVMNLKYYLNDFIEIYGIYNFYPDGSLPFGIPENISDQVILGMKTNF